MVSLIGNDSSRLLIVKKALYHPITLLAVGLHALILAMPLRELPASEPEVAEEVPEEVAVDILNLSDIASTTPPVAKPATGGAPVSGGAPAAARSGAAAPSNLANPARYSPPAAVQSSSAASPAPVVGVPSNLAAGIPVGALAATVSATGAVPVGAAPVGAVPGGSTGADTGGTGGAVAGGGGPVATGGGPVGQPVYDPGQDQGVFITGLQSLGVQDNSAAVGLPSNPNMFRRPAGFGYFLDITNPDEPQPIATAREARWLEKQTDELFAQLQATYAQSNIAFNRLDDYGGEQLYELKNAQGQTAMFISLVDLKGSSLLVMWDNKPQ